MKNLLFAFLAALLILAATQASAERNFPEQAKRGDMKAYEYPLMKIGENVFRLSPGSRIFNQRNLIITPASLEAQATPVMFTLDIRGDLSRIWLLTKEEAARFPMPKAPTPLPKK